MSRRTMASYALVPPNTTIPLSARTIRAAFPRYTTQVAWVEVTSGGSGYATAPTVSFSGGGGSGAAATALIRGGAVVAVSVTNTGANYTSTPTVSFSGGGGTGAAATAYRVDPLADMIRVGASHCVWHYITDIPFAASITNAGINLQGTLTGLLPRTTPNACTVSFDGQPVPVGWLAGQGLSFGAAARSAYMAHQISQYNSISVANPGSIHFDDAASDLSSMRSVNPSGTGGSFDSETLSGFRPNYVAELQAAGVVQQPYNWTTQTYDPSPTGNWNARYESTIPAEFPNKTEYQDHLRSVTKTFHTTLKATLFSNKLYTVNAYDILPKGNSSAWMLSFCDGALFEPDTDTYSSASPATYAQRFQRLWANAKTCEGAGKLFIPHLSPLRNDTVNSATRADRIDLLRRQTALCYALGGLPTYPYDVYLPPFQDSPVIQNERFFAKSTDGFDPLYKFVKDYSNIFDGFVSRSALLLASDVTTDSGRDVNGQLMPWADTCLRNIIPATFYSVGPTLPRNLEAESRALRVVNVSPGSTYSDAITGSNVVSISSFPYTSWAGLASAGSLTGTYTDVFAIPRLGSNRQVFHIVNFDTVVRSNLTLTVRHWALQSYRRRAVRWFEPGQPPRELSAVMGGAGLEIRLPPVDIWGVVVIEQ